METPKAGVGAALLPSFTATAISAGMIQIATALTDVLHLCMEQDGKFFLVRTDIPTGIPPVRQRSLILQASVSDE